MITKSITVDDLAVTVAKVRSARINYDKSNVVVSVSYYADADATDPSTNNTVTIALSEPVSKSSLETALTTDADSPLNGGTIS